MSSGLTVKKKKKKTDKLNFEEVTSDSSLLKPCTSSYNGVRIVEMCVLGDGKNAMDWFLFNISLDCLTKLGQTQIKLETTQHGGGFDQIASGFHHQLLHLCHHRHFRLNRDESLVIPPIFSLNKKSVYQPISFWGNTFASLGSLLFSIGGSTAQDDDISGSNLVCYLDTRHPYHGWKQAPSMISSRFKPQVVSLNGKLYVFGCSGLFKCKHGSDTCGGVWAEVFEPFLDADLMVTGRWEKVPNPPPQLLEADKFLVITPQNDLSEEEEDCLRVSKKETILVRINRTGGMFCSSACEFNIATGLWELFECDFWWGYDDSMVGAPILVDGVLYWADKNINAFDIQTGYNYVGPVQDLVFEDEMSKVFGVDYAEGYAKPPSRPSFIHLGGRHFCLMTFVRDSFHCLVIRVSRTQKLFRSILDSDDFLLNVSVLSCQSYPIDGRYSLLDGRMLV